jgi:nucleotide exchange factor SIL1
MTRLRLKMLPLNLVALISLMAWSAAASTSSLSSSNEASPSASPAADVELICHTDNPAECYPKIFQATDEFQVVHDDQDLPLGLHVRLNVYTGKKEAKINVPDENDAALEGLPVDSSMVIVERDQSGQGGEASDQVRLPPNAPPYDPAGKVKTPKSAKSDEGNAFYKSLAILKKGLDVDEALEMLEDISHDIYYGLKIAEDYETVRELFCLAASGSSSAASNAEASLTRARLAALTLSSAVQNNQKALAEIERHWTTKLSSSLCRSDSSEPLGTTTFVLLGPSSSSQSSSTVADSDPALTKARISLLSGLLRSPILRRDFLASGGPSHLLRILIARDPQPEWLLAQRTAAFLLLDNFLDPDMGAAMGEWPTQAQLPKKECEARESKQQGNTGEEEECLDWHVEQLRSRHAASDHWSHELWSKLGKWRKAEAAGQAQTNNVREKTDL